MYCRWPALLLHRVTFTLKTLITWLNQPVVVVSCDSPHMAAVAVHLLKIHSAQSTTCLALVTQGSAAQHYWNLFLEFCFCLTYRQLELCWCSSSHMLDFSFSFCWVSACGWHKPRRFMYFLFVSLFSGGYWQSKTCLLRYFHIRQIKFSPVGEWVFGQTLMLSVRPENQSVSVGLQSAARHWLGPNLHPLLQINPFRRITDFL